VGAIPPPQFFERRRRFRTDYRRLAENGAAGDIHNTIFSITHLDAGALSRPLSDRSPPKEL
jgi:hypothetical protein